MSTTIDKKVVEMQFNNSNFESNVKTSMNTLEKLKNALNFSGSTKGLEDLNSAVNNVNMSGLGSAVQTVQEKFSALEVVAISALATITNQAVQAGEQLVASLTVDNIAAGWEKFASKTTSVGTLVAQGYDLDTVTEQLERLNWYTDETSYNFTDMVSNIAKFTASGQDLETSVTAMEGIANWAALSGQNATTASQAMYQLSQAMSAGYMRLEDYKSIQNASMDTAEFRQKCIDAAIALGTLEENADGTYTSIVDGAETCTFSLSSFTTGLTKGAWLTSDVMMSVFNDYSNAVDQIYEYAEEKGITASEAIEELGDSVDEFGLKAFKAAQEARTWADVVDSVKDAASTSWMNIFELFIGNYEQATSLYTNMANSLYDIFIEPLNTLYDTLEGALSNSPFTELAEKIEDLADPLTGLVTVTTLAKRSTGEYEFTANNLAEALADMSEEVSVTADELAKMSTGEYEFTANNLAEAFADMGEEVSVTADELAKMSTAELQNLGLTESEISALRELSRMAKSAETSVEDLLENIDQYNGRTILLEDLKTACESLMSVLSAIGQAWSNVFPATTSEQVYDMITAFRRFANSMELSEEQLDRITNIFQGFFSVIDIVQQAVVALFKGFTSLFDGAGDLAGGIFNLADSFADWLIKLDESIKESDIFNTAVQTVVDYIKKAVGIASEYIEKAIQVVGGFTEKIKEWLNLPDLSTLTTSVKEFIGNVKEKFATPGFNSFKEALSKIGEVIEEVISSIFGLKDSTSESFEAMDNTVSNSTLVSIFTTLWKAVTAVASAIQNVLTKAVEGLVSAAGNIDFTSIMSAIKELLTGGFIASAIELLHNFASGLGGISDFAEKLEKGVTNILESFGSVLQSWSTNIKAESLLKIAEAIGILTIALIALTAVDTDKLGTAIAAVSGLCVDLVAAMTALQVLTGANSTNPLSAITNFMDSMSNSKQYSNMIKIAAAIGILAASLALLASVDQSNIASSFAAITALFADITASMVVLSKFGGKTSGLATMIGLAASILILSSAVKSLAELSWDEIAKGLVSVTALCVELTAAMIALNQFGGKTSGAITMIAMAAALEIMASACKSFAAMSWDELARGLVAMAASLAELVVALNFAKGTTTASAALLIASAALEVLANVLNKMSGLSWNEVAVGLVVMGGALAELAIALNAMKGTLSGSASLLIAAAAIEVLTPAIKALGNLSIAQVATALITLAGAFTIIGVAAAVLSPLTTTILALSGAFTLIGVGVAAVGVGLVAAGAGVTAIATGIVSLATSVAVGGASIISGIESIIVSIISFIPDVLVAIGEGIVGICGVIAEGAPTIASAVVAVISSILSLLVETVPQFVETVAALLSSILSTLVEYAPLIVQNVLSLLTACLNTIAENLGSVIESAVSVVLAFISGIVTQIPVVVDAAFQMIISFINGLADAIEQNTPLLIESVQNLFVAIIDAAVSILFGAVDTFIEAGGTLISGLVEGILGAVGSVVDAVSNVVSSVVGGFANLLGINSPADETIELGEYTSEGLAVGLTNGESDVVAATESVGSSALESLTESLSGFSDLGSDSMTELIDGISSSGLDLSSVTSETIDSSMLSTLTESLSGTTEIGSDSITDLISGITSQSTELNATTTETIENDLLTPMTDSLSATTEIGSDSIVNLISGMTSQGESLNASTFELAEGGAESARGSYSSFEAAGAYLVDGFAAGISANTYAAVAQASAMASAAADAARATLEIASPSKVGYEIGDFFGLGFVNAIGDYGDTAYDTSAGMANEARNGLITAVSQLADIVSGDLDMEPTIRPVLDLSEIEKGASKISTLFNYSHAMEVSASMNRAIGTEIQNGENIANGKGGNTYQFNQYNTSPKALSRTEIYRQTRNQFSGFERMVEA